MDKIETMDIKDKLIAAALKTAGQELIKVETREHTVYFVFRNINFSCDDLIADYHLGRLKLDAKLLMQNESNIRDLFFAEKKKQEGK